MGKRRKRQVLDGTGRRLSCIGRLSVDLRQQQHSTALWATKQPSLGTALLRDGPRKGGLSKVCLSPTWCASRGQRASLPNGKKNERKKQTANLKAASWNICTMQDSEDRPQQHSVLMAKDLAQLDIDITALSEARFVEQGSLEEDGAGYYPLLF